MKRMIARGFVMLLPAVASTAFGQVPGNLQLNDVKAYSDTQVWYFPSAEATAPVGGYGVPDTGCILSSGCLSSSRIDVGNLKPVAAFGADAGAGFNGGAPTVYAQVYGNGMAYATFRYSFEVVEPGGGAVGPDFVTLGIAGKAVTDFSPLLPSNVQIDGGFEIYPSKELNPLPPVYSTNWSLISAQGKHTYDLGQATYDVLPGLEYIVYMRASVQIGQTGTVPPFSDFNFHASVLVDPTFTLPQNLLDAGYQLRFSPTYEQALIASVPEPSTWSLMAAGLLVLCGSCIRRNKTRCLLAAE